MQKLLVVILVLSALWPVSGPSHLRTERADRISKYLPPELIAEGNPFMTGSFITN